MNWFNEQRLMWIKESVDLFGYINREQIMRKFGVSTPQASHDLREAQIRWPNLMGYNKSSKRYESLVRQNYHEEVKGKK